ncbi:MAG: hypothetical protein FWG11_07205, partial [Promicromonosporaceae bacterium]|nr:hypothetical protein [Promicromonosporaceae bacterium]
TLPGLDSAADPATGYADPVRLIARDWVLVNAGIVSVQDGGIDLPPTPTPPPGGGGGSVGGRPALPITGATIAGFLAVAGGLIAVGIATGGAAGTEAFAKSRLRARRGGN